MCDRQNKREGTMRTKNGLSRRHLLRTAGAAGGLALAGRALAQAPARKIEQLAPELDKIIATSEPIQELASGFGGDLGPAEGPLWWKEGGYLLFSDIHSNRRMKYTPGRASRCSRSRPTAPTVSPAICRGGCLRPSMIQGA